MKTTLFASALIFIWAFGFAQTDISGHWTGMLYQSAGGLAAEYTFEMDIKQSGTTITGTSHIELSPAVTGSMEVQGKLNGKVFTYSEPRIINEDGITDTTAWCLKTCRLLLSRVGDRLYLKGTWSGYSLKFGDCSPGTIELTKLAPVKVEVAEKPSAKKTKESIAEKSTVTIVMQDKATGKQLSSAELRLGVESEEKKLVDGVEYGRWSGSLIPNQYYFVAQASGYYAYEGNFLLKKGENQEVICLMSPVHTGDVFRMDNLYFEQSKAVITPTSDVELQKLVDFMKVNKGISILISGHTDSVGSSYANKVLSINRAKAVVAYLVAHGIDEGRMEHKGYGEEKPVASNDTPEGKAQNRRVEVEIISIRD